MFYNFNPESFRPEQHLLDACFKVVIDNPEEKPWEMRKWCVETTESFVWMDVDVIGFTDKRVTMYFYNVMDTTLFRLKFVK